MKQYRLIVAYDGTDYCGWQVQVLQKSIAQEMQDAFERVFGQSIRLLGASRTDAGVHALGQVAVFKINIQVNTQKMLFAWNNVLPQSIRIISIEEVTDNFHPYRNKTEKTYWYNFFTDQPLPFATRYGWYVRKKIDMQKLRQCLKVFQGTHDFASFCTKNEKENTVRTINSINLEYVKEFNCYRIEVKRSWFFTAHDSPYCRRKSYSCNKA